MQWDVDEKSGEGFSFDFLLFCSQKISPSFPSVQQENGTGCWGSLAPVPGGGVRRDEGEGLLF